VRIFFWAPVPPIAHATYPQKGLLAKIACRREAKCPKAPCGTNSDNRERHERGYVYRQIILETHKLKFIVPMRKLEIHADCVGENSSSPAFHGKTEWPGRLYSEGVNDLLGRLPARDRCAGLLHGFAVCRVPKAGEKYAADCRARWRRMGRPIPCRLTMQHLSSR